MQRKSCRVLQRFSWLSQAQSFKEENMVLWQAGFLWMELLEGASPLSLSGTDDFFFSEDFFKSLMTRVIQTWACTLFKQWLNLPGSKTDDVTMRAELKLRLCASGPYVPLSKGLLSAASKMPQAISWLPVGFVLNILISCCREQFQRVLQEETCL